MCPLLFFVMPESLLQYQLHLLPAGHRAQRQCCVDWHMP